jgi:hypothetical protein
VDGVFGTFRVLSTRPIPTFKRARSRSQLGAGVGAATRARSSTSSKMKGATTAVENPGRRALLPGRRMPRRRGTGDDPVARAVAGEASTDQRRARTAILGRERRARRTTS